ncbi:hypothetical protein [Pseudomonas sp. CHM02]|uniref:hypothetical protein n=1 Tax=Pseudomonas sp. CHM02 TaxID=1463662 RepID=UPI0012DC1858|nr:hypothetical protein [Pseudomonas sp. CHM02]
MSGRIIGRLRAIPLTAATAADFQGSDTLLSKKAAPPKAGKSFEQPFALELDVSLPSPSSTVAGQYAVGDVDEHARPFNGSNTTWIADNARNCCNQYRPWK